MESKRNYVVEVALPIVAAMLAATLLIVVIWVVFNGDNYFPELKQKELEEKVSEARNALNESGINNQFKFEQEMHLIAYALERKVETKIDLLFIDKGKNSVEIISNTITPEYMNDCEYRELYKANLTLLIIDKLNNKDCDTVAIIVSWTRTKSLLQPKDKYYSVCDFDGNGEWDYLMEGLYKSDSMVFVDKIPEDTGIYQEINGEIIGLSAGCYKNNINMIKLKDLTEDITFKSLEGLLD